jgi:hypothetical protein
MDTRFWGPSGWKLLHHIAFSYEYTTENAILYAAFIETIPYILPCKFCRYSLTDYYRQYPFALGNSFMDPLLDLPRWMYKIHNCVNDKLRRQGLYPSPNPSFQQVKHHYDTVIHTSWKQQMTLFWDFLFSVAYHHPREKQLYSTPMPECPPKVRYINDSCERNKWNVLPVKKRVWWFYRFWSILPAVFPKCIIPHWKRAVEKYPPTLATREKTMNWLWRMRCELDTDYHDPYRSVCRQIANYSSDCTTRKGAITCRGSKGKKSKNNSKRKGFTRKKDRN